MPVWGDQWRSNSFFDRISFACELRPLTTRSKTLRVVCVDGVCRPLHARRSCSLHLILHFVHAFPRKSGERTSSAMGSNHVRESLWRCGLKPIVLLDRCPALLQPLFSRAQPFLSLIHSFRFRPGRVLIYSMDKYKSVISAVAHTLKIPCELRCGGCRINIPRGRESAG